MDYEKEYKAALERCREFYAKLGNKQLKEEVEDVFPELRESEDEKIRKDIIHYIEFGKNHNIIPCKRAESWIAYLEKQGEQKPAMMPKFRVGDWVVVDGVTQQVTQIRPDGFDTDKAWNGKLTFKDVHLWTIQDAKDGDVLANKYGDVMLFKGMTNDRHICGYCQYSAEDRKLYNECSDFPNYYPSTKEQSDLLFQKMKEAGYEWDAEKKELKKTEQNPTDELSAFKNKLLELFQTFRWKCKDHILTNGDIIDYVDTHIQEIIDTMQKPACAWSKEDETYLDHIITAIKSYYTDDKGKENPWRNELLRWLKSLKDRVQPKHKQEWSKEDEKMIENIIDTINMSIEDCDVDDIGTKARFSLEKERDWLKNKLKSLRPQSTWKPSDEQMDNK